MITNLLHRPTNLLPWHFAQTPPNGSIPIPFQCLRQTGGISGGQYPPLGKQVKDIPYQTAVEGSALLFALVVHLAGYGRQFEDALPQGQIAVTPLPSHMVGVQTHDILQNGIRGKLRVAGCVLGYQHKFTLIHFFQLWKQREF